MITAVLPDGTYECHPYTEGRGPWPSERLRYVGDYVRLVDGKIEDPSPIMKLAFDIEMNRHLGVPPEEASAELREKYPEFFEEGATSSAPSPSA